MVGCGKAVMELCDWEYGALFPRLEEGLANPDPLDHAVLICELAGQRVRNSDE